MQGYNSSPKKSQRKVTFLFRRSGDGAQVGPRWGLQREAGQGACTWGPQRALRGLHPTPTPLAAPPARPPTALRGDQLAGGLRRGPAPVDGLAGLAGKAVSAGVAAPAVQAPARKHFFSTERPLATRPPAARRLPPAQRRWSLAGAPAAPPALEASFEGHVDWVNDLALMGELLVSASSDRTLRVWSAGGREGECGGAGGAGGARGGRTGGCTCES